MVEGLGQKSEDQASEKLTFGMSVIRSKILGPKLFEISVHKKFVRENGIR